MTADPSLAKIPVTVITGFLGAGKTTLIRHLMANPQGRRLAILVNEFGTLGVDGTILKDCADAMCPAENIVELANGCICCTVADDFIPTVEALLALPVRPDHILIETSGLALPKPLLRAFDWPAIRSRITVDGVVTLADAEAVAAGRFAPDPAAVEVQRAAEPGIDHETPLSEVFEDQIACADIILLSKADLAGEAGLAAARAAIAAETSRPVPMIAMTEGAIDPRCLGLFSYNKDMALQESIPCVVGVYALRVRRLLRTFPERSERRRKWFNVEKAAKRVAEPELRSLLLAAKGVLPLPEISTEATPARLARDT